MPQVESRQHGAGAAHARVSMHGDDFVGRQQPVNALTKSDCLLQRRRVHVRHRIRRPADPELCGQRRLYRFFRERDQVCHTDCAERVEVITDVVDDAGTGDAAQAARDAGADVVGADDLVTRVAGGFLDFDIAIATPDQMAQVGKLGKVLGPRGLMPNPKTGTVTTDVGRAVTEFKAGRVEYRTDRHGNVHVPVGRASFSAEALLGNFRAVLDELNRAKPATAKGRYMRALTVASSQGPGVKVDITRLRPEDDEAAE